MKKVLATDPIHPEAVLYMENNGFEVRQKSHMTEQEIINCIHDYDAIICRTSTKITRNIIEAGKNLQCVGVHATGWDHIDLDAAKENNVVILGYPSNNDRLEEDRLNGSFVPVAEYVLMTMLATTKRLIEADSSMKSEKWEKYNLSGSELYRKTLGIIGLGRIGSLVAERALAFGMNVIAYHPRLNEEDCKKRGATQASLEELFRESDFVTIHVPKTKDNIGLVDKKAFKLMDKKPVIINTSRASIVDEEALEEALSENLIKAAVLDVFDNAPKGINWNLVKNPKVIATPHIAGVSDEGLSRVSSHISKLVTNFLNEGRADGQING